MTISVGIFGASGYTGGELVRLLATHPDIDIAFVTSERHAGQPLSAIFPHLASLPERSCHTLSESLLSAQCDVAFCALPHLTSMDVVPELIEQGVRVVDLSADFRLRDASVYQTWYGAAHRAQAMLSEAVYGLPELNYREAIAKARLVANPGCYPTSVLLALAPLLQANAIDPSMVIIDSKSGVSGAGRSLVQGSLFSELEGGFRAYKTTGHRHTPEIEQELGRLADADIRVRFSPHLIPQSRGILSTCYLRPRQTLTLDDWQTMLSEYYREEPFVQVLPVGAYPATNHVRGSNFCRLAVDWDPRTGWLVVISVIDNLVKGAAGQAVQNMNIMFELDESAGLQQLPLFP